MTLVISARKRLYHALEHYDRSDPASVIISSIVVGVIAINLIAIILESIPAYVERATLLLVLVPVCNHVDRKQPCNFATWRRRGWCRLEMYAALFQCGEMQVMICTGGEALPYF